jgi:hypothetical protein
VPEVATQQTKSEELTAKIASKREKMRSLKASLQQAEDKSSDL